LQALEWLRDGSIQDLRVMLLDLSMPDLSGEEALPLLRAAAPGVPIIALSGHVAASVALPGIAGVLQKPLGQRDLIEAVRLAVMGGA
jgi:DNA-binding NarL/FixJ family response regulator